MARTLVGTLLLAFKDNMSPGAKRAADNVSNSFRRIERNANRLSSAKWGTGFQKQLDSLKLSPKEFAQVESSWNRLHRNISRKGLGSALARGGVAAWKTSVLSHFADVRREIRKTEASHTRLTRAMSRGLTRSALVAGGFYTAPYALGALGRRAGSASSQRQRELFRQDQIGLKDGERDAIKNKARDISIKYPSVAQTDIMKLGRVARNLMGDAERGNSVLENLIRTMVVLQSVNGPEQAVTQLEALIRGFDNLGVNKDGQKGVEQVNDLMNLIVKASQVEGSDFNVGDLLKFGRRSKNAGPALSQDFIGAIAPVLMQDSSADIAGNQISQFFKNFVVGLIGRGTGKHNLEERARIGILSQDGRAVKESALGGQNPYEWTKKVLIPALQRDGVDLTDGTAISQAVGKLTGNSGVAGLLARMITQQEQIERSITQYNQAKGISVAEDARNEDPFVAAKALTGALSNLSAAVGEKTMPTIVSGINTFADTINRFASNVENGSGKLMAVTGGGAALAGGFAAYKGIKGIKDMLRAGPQLISAADELKLAAKALTNGDDKKGKKGKRGGAAGAGLAGGIAGAATSHPVAAGVTAAGLAAYSYFRPKYEEASKRHLEKYGAKIEADKQHFLKHGHQKTEWKGGFHEMNKLFEARRARDTAYIEAERAEIASIGTSAANSDIDGVVSKSQTAGAEIEANLSPSAKPAVDSSDIDAAIEKAKVLVNTLNQASAASATARQQIDAALRRSLTDFQGVAP